MKPDQLYDVDEAIVLGSRRIERTEKLKEKEQKG